VKKLKRWNLPFAGGVVSVVAGSVGSGFFCDMLVAGL